MAPRNILIREGKGNYVVTMYNSTDAIKPGHIVTTTGESGRGVCWPDAAGDIAYGVVGCAPGHDVDTAYSVGDMVPVYPRTGGAMVWVRIKTSAGAIVRGQAIMHDGATAVNGLGILGVDSATLFATKIGAAEQISADVAAERWCKVGLES